MKQQKPKKTKSPSDYPTLTIRIPADLLARLKAIKQNDHRSFGQLVTLALRKQYQ